MDFIGRTSSDTMIKLALPFEKKERLVQISIFYSRKSTQDWNTMQHIDSCEQNGFLHEAWNKSGHMTLMYWFLLGDCCPTDVTD